MLNLNLPSNNFYSLVFILPPALPREVYFPFLMKLLQYLKPYILRLSEPRSMKVPILAEAEAAEADHSSEGMQLWE